MRAILAFIVFLDYRWEPIKEMERKDRLLKMSEVSYVFKKGECASLFTVPSKHSQRLSSVLA